MAVTMMSQDWTTRSGFAEPSEPCNISELCRNEEAEVLEELLPVDHSVLVDIPLPAFVKEGGRQLVLAQKPIAVPVQAIRRARPYCCAPQFVPTIATIAVPKPKAMGCMMYSSLAPIA